MLVRNADERIVQRVLQSTAEKIHATPPLRVEIIAASMRFYDACLSASLDPVTKVEQRIVYSLRLLPAPPVTSTPWRVAHQASDTVDYTDQRDIQL